jgi:hypothetical protein
VRASELRHTIAHLRAGHADDERVRITTSTEKVEQHSEQLTAMCGKLI